MIVGAVTGQTIVDLSDVAKSAWFQVPSFDILFVDYHFKLYPSAILTMAPIAFVTMTEHFGHVMVLNSLTGRDFFKDPGLIVPLQVTVLHKLSLVSSVLPQ